MDSGKTCSACEEWKPYDGFYADKSAASGFRSDCKECLKARHRRRYATEEWYAEYHREKDRKRRMAKEPTTPTRVDGA